MMVVGNMMRRTLAKLGIAAVLGVASTAGAQATYSYFDVMSDPGSYGPISLGDSITLNACGSTFHRADGTSQSYSLCDLSNLQDFTLSWIGVQGEDYEVLSTYYGNNISNGLETTVSTGSGTFFYKFS